jgi:hypothetical protein
MTRAVLRFADHTIRHVAEVGVTFEAFCASGCDDTSGPQKDQEAAQDWALRHAGCNPDHDLFRRVVTDHARVTRNEP